MIYIKSHYQPHSDHIPVIGFLFLDFPFDFDGTIIVLCRFAFPFLFLPAFFFVIDLRPCFGIEFAANRAAFDFLFVDALRSVLISVFDLLFESLFFETYRVINRQKRSDCKHVMWSRDVMNDDNQTREKQIESID